MSGNVLQKYFNPAAIKLAFYRVQCWPERMAKDLVGMRAFAAELAQNCENLSDKLIQGTYKPKRGFKYYVPKSSLTNRTKTMLFVEDAIVYQAIANQLAADSYEMLYEHESFVFGSVLSPETKKGLAILEEQEPNFFFFRFWKTLFNTFKESIIQSIEVDKAKFKFETDITGFFDCIPHYNLLSTLSEKFGVEDEILDILSECLNAWSGTKDSITPGVGIPQGPIPSHLLANMLLHELDELVIGKGFKYYRYMDDIKIYGYEEKDLIKALVLIDKHLKGNGLSINSKKTTIEEIDENEEDATVKELRKVDSFSEYFEDEDSTIIQSVTLDQLTNEANDKKGKSKSDKELKDASGLGEQENQSLNELKISETLTEEADIIEFWESQLMQVENELPRLFKDPEQPIEELELVDDICDIDFIRMSAQYGTSLRSLRSYQPKLEANTGLLKYWLFAYKKYFWRANNFGLALALYKNNALVKSFLMDLVNNQFEHYEWARFMAIQTISLTQSFDDRELRQIFFKKAQEETSDLVKISLYRLLFKHSKSKQFTATLSKQLQKESNWYLKVSITDFNRNHKNNELDIVEFIQSIGL